MIFTFPGPQGTPVALVVRQIKKLHKTKSDQRRFSGVPNYEKC